MKTKKPLVAVANLDAAYHGSYLTWAGCGGPLSDWTNGLDDLMAKNDIGTPVAWYRTDGRAVNAYADAALPAHLSNGNPFADDCTLLLCPLDGLDVPRLAVVRLAWGARWFDDVIDNMRDSVDRFGQG